MVAFLKEALSSDELMSIEESLMQGEHALTSTLKTTQEAGRDILREVYPLLDGLLRSLARKARYPSTLKAWGDDAPFQALVALLPLLSNSSWYQKRRGELKGF
jgi:hypothetical protein